MRTTDERLKQIEMRAAVLKAKRRRRKQKTEAVLCTAACLLLITVLGLQMPGIAERFSANGTAHTLPAASLIGGSAVRGYIIMGVLAFLLGVCCTLLLYRLRKRQSGADKKNKTEDNDEL